MISNKDSKLGISDQDFNGWLHHPVTSVFKTFLDDYREKLVSIMVSRWEAGNLNLMDEQECRGRVLVIKEIMELRLGTIESFYGLEEKEE